MSRAGRSSRLTWAGGALLAALVAVLIAAGAAEARKPLIAHVDGTQLLLYDSHTGKDTVLPVPIANANGFRYGISANGRFVFYNDANKKLHLLDRNSGKEVALPGIDVYMNPGFLTVSSFGLLAFDDNGNGPALVYDSNKGTFVPTGFAANNGHRQTQLSGFGNALATTCPMNCAADLNNDVAPFVQDLATLSDTGVPNVNMSDEEDPCINQDSNFVGWHRGVPMQKDVFVFDRRSGFVGLPGLNHPVDDDTFCMLDAAAEYVGFMRENVDTMQLYERKTSQLLPLPASIEPPQNNQNQRFAAPTCGGRYATRIGSSGRDVLKGTKGIDIMLDLEGRDKLIGRAGKDRLCGGKGRDRLIGGKGKDKLIGGPGRDRQTP